ncbi:MAG TPA: prolyl oligopeptidase family serine peptidase [Ktedonobacteraceae bacterium]|jgi:predicted peptidase|nr:prolyl oligopeptidase family serine peptidase [Ktedonobacteraceae bacterium]
MIIVGLALIALGIFSNDSASGKGRQTLSQHIPAPIATQNPTPTAAQPSETATTFEGFQTFIYTDITGMKMTYYLYIPAHYNAQKKYPLVLILHGGGEVAKPSATPQQNSKVLLTQFYVQTWISPAVQQQWPSFILVPQVMSPDRWVNVPASTGSYTMAAQPSNSLRMAKEILDMVQQQYKGIDASRLYITGLSMGGYGTWEAIERWPDYFAAAAPLSGAGDPSKAYLLVDEPIWAFHGAKDTVVPVSGSRDMIAAITQAGGHPLYTEYPDAGHGLWGPGGVYDPKADLAFFEWLFSQKLP